MAKSTTAGKVAAGLGVAALAAGAAAAYFLTGKDGQKNRKDAKAWVVKAKSDLAKKIKDAEKLTKSAYESAATEVLAKYKQAKNIDPVELAAFGKELKGHWDEISKHAEKFNTKKPIKAIKAKRVTSDKK